MPLRFTDPKPINMTEYAICQQYTHTDINKRDKRNTYHTTKQQSTPIIQEKYKKVNKNRTRIPQNNNYVCQKHNAVSSSQLTIQD
jgi:hypothetical protein